MAQVVLLVAPCFKILPMHKERLWMCKVGLWKNMQVENVPWTPATILKGYLKAGQIVVDNFNPSSSCDCMNSFFFSFAFICERIHLHGHHCASPNQSGSRVWEAKCTLPKITQTVVVLMKIVTPYPNHVRIIRISLGIFKWFQDISSVWATNSFPLQVQSSHGLQLFPGWAIWGHLLWNRRLLALRQGCRGGDK